MRLDAVFTEPAYRKVVDADGPDSAIREVTGRLLGDVHVILDESFSPPTPGRVLRLEQDTLAAADPVRVEFVRFDGNGVLDLITRARPTVASSGIRSMPSPPGMKWIGASMCVPVCDPSEITDTLAASPRSMSSIRSIRTGGLSGQWTMPLRSGTEISIHPSSLGVRDPLAHTGYPPFRFRCRSGDPTLSGRYKELRARVCYRPFAVATRHV